MKIPTNEIKKVLYREKPIAKFHYRDDTTGGVVYRCNCSLGEVIFDIPAKEYILDSGKEMANEVPAQLLIRYLPK